MTALRTRLAPLAGAVLALAGLVVAPPSVAAAAEGHGGQARPTCPPGTFCVYRAPDYQGPSWS
ncbi:peptidase inhibitor family I36 protein [Streptomyces sp. SDr-06]|uniref:peptidase inhibitor family I36 protein n=1 Tax=Streptomyces sp. SDr-06 TaxID=2267702 RepID=UPI001672A970|nr:peptidase inhibitor family I36 protein [Streptomyces sp. SDr-06]